VTLLMKETSKLPFPTWQNQGRTIELTYGKKAKLQKMSRVTFY